MAQPQVKPSKPLPKLSISVMLEMLCAVHLSSYVESPFQDHGGLMIVGPPGVLKSTFLSILDRNYHDALSLSDLNMRTLVDYRDHIAARTIRTLVIPEYKKIWERHKMTASNVEGTIRALAGEGFMSAGFEDSRPQRLRARCTIFAAMTPKFQADHYREWEEDGFNRRFLWSLVRLQDPQLVDKAVELWELVDVNLARIPPTPVASIPNLTTREERAAMRLLVKYQPGGNHGSQVAIMAKTLSVLKWWYKILKRPDGAALATIRTFAQSLGKEGAELTI